MRVKGWHGGRSWLVLIAIALTGVIVAVNSASDASTGDNVVPKHLQDLDPNVVDWSKKTDGYWREVLSEDRYNVCRAAGTERPFSGEYCKTHADGDYFCYCCGQLLFSSDEKFDSGTGWPSFSEAATPGALEYVEDRSHGMVRTEVRCKRCGAHLGHVFDDGPAPSGKRYCINSICLFRGE